MTAEHRLLCELSDIVALTLTCTKCGIRVSVAPDKVEPEQLRQCPSCSALWLANDDAVNSPIRGGPYTFFMLALRRLRGAQNPDMVVGFNLRLEFADASK